jgi:Na+-translocating ferredoxin:NAD+ oxidoreductase RnfD subunit
LAGPGRDNTRVSYVKTGGGLSETWHSPDCPTLTIMQISFEESSKRVKEQDAWAAGVFPAAYERLKQAAAALPAGTSAQPFIDALTELVQAQADTTGFVTLPRWAEILDRHFPPDLPDPAYVKE